MTSGIEKRSIIYNISLFRITYTISLLFEIIAFPPIEMLAGWINGVTFFWGIVICLHMMFHESYKFEIENKKIAFVFILFCLFTSCVNLSNNFLMNLINTFNNYIYMFLFFGMNKNTAKEDIEKEMNFIFKFIICFSFLISLLSMYISFRYKYINFMGHDLGIFKDRFFGISTNPNQLGFLSVISIFSCELLNDRYMKKKFKFNSAIQKLFIIFNICILFLTDSNASFVLMTVYFIIRVFYENFSKYEKIRDIKFVREVIFISICMLITVSGSFLTRFACQKFMNKIVNHQNNSLNLDNNKKIISNEFVKESHLGRGNHELSSGRLLFLKQGIKLCKIHPLIGIGRENLGYYSKLYSNGRLVFNFKHPDLHNLYLTLLVSYGIIGFSLFVIFILLILYKIAYTVFINMHTEKGRFLSKLFAIIIAYLCYVNFEVGVLSGIAFSDVLIWIYLGYAMLFVENP